MKSRHQLRPVVRTLLTLVVALGLFSASAQPSGQDVYSSSCMSCHQGNGQGMPGVFPPIAGHVGDLYEASGGYDHILNVVLFGMQGPITVKGTEYDSVMPGQFQLSDEEVAAVVNYVMTAWGDADEVEGEVEPVTVDEVASARNRALSPQLVHQNRPELAGEEGGEASALDLEPATFTLAQVERARPTYVRLCAECHGDSLGGGLIGGPPLSGPYFENRWGGQQVSSLYTYTKTRMPQDRPDSLAPQTYADLVALILSHNGHEASDTELTSDPSQLEQFGILD